jgi:hypothetical protein
MEIFKLILLTAGGVIFGLFAISSLGYLLGYSTTKGIIAAKKEEAENLSEIITEILDKVGMDKKDEKDIK